MKQTAYGLVALAIAVVFWPVTLFVLACIAITACSKDEFSDGGAP
jgi:hypothetical protein